MNFIELEYLNQSFRAPYKRSGVSGGARERKLSYKIIIIQIHTKTPVLALTSALCAREIFSRPQALI